MEVAELIAKLERASGPDAWLDRELADIALGPIRPPLVRGNCPKYTSSIDAAMTLVPEGWMLWGLSDLMFDGSSGCTLIDCAGGEAISFGAKTLPLDICIAALKARAQIAGA